VAQKVALSSKKPMMAKTCGTRIDGGRSKWDAISLMARMDSIVLSGWRSMALSDGGETGVLCGLNVFVYSIRGWILAGEMSPAYLTKQPNK
jgi:hypothetical protein